MTQLQQEEVRVTDAAVARALRQGHGFLGHFLAPRSPSEVAPALGMAPNLVHHHARRLADLGLLFEARREGGKVYYQLAAREFRVPSDLLPPGDEEGNGTADLRELSRGFLRAYERSWSRMHAGEEDLFGFGDAGHPARPAPMPSGPAAEPCPTHLDALTLRLSPERYARLARAITALLDEAAADGVREGGYPCTVALLAFQGVLGESVEERFQGVSRSTSSFLGALTV
ncbi:winged helix-turn-helix domain-containing protein [Deinococcus sp. NW-56]|uniref:winged helix-turn-helix domain-containing protein n=1 Tax=Deinococcus sp. NW-56 TaxID=2080419 RepID=UPI000CF49A04|nr:winged helix-turn-helix domain-containing protein [Deinococcus sp. NW-56]